MAAPGVLVLLAMVDCWSKIVKDRVPISNSDELQIASSSYFRRLIRYWAQFRLILVARFREFGTMILVLYCFFHSSRILTDLLPSRACFVRHGALALVKRCD